MIKNANKTQSIDSKTKNQWLMTKKKITDKWTFATTTTIFVYFYKKKKIKKNIRQQYSTFKVKFLSINDKETQGK